MLPALRTPPRSAGWTREHSRGVKQRSLPCVRGEAALQQGHGSLAPSARFASAIDAPERGDCLCSRVVTQGQLSEDSWSGLSSLLTSSESACCIHDGLDHHMVQH